MKIGRSCGNSGVSRGAALDPASGGGGGAEAARAARGRSSRLDSAGALVEDDRGEKVSDDSKPFWTAFCLPISCGGYVTGVNLRHGSSSFMECLV